MIKCSGHIRVRLLAHASSDKVRQLNKLGSSPFWDNISVVLAFRSPNQRAVRYAI
jgi:hypothetical protein